MSDYRPVYYASGPKKGWNLNKILVLYDINRVKVFGSIDYGKNQVKQHP